MKLLLTRESIDNYRPDPDLVILARDAGFMMPDFAVEYGNDWGGRKATLMWIALAKFRHLVQQEEKIKFADAYVEFKKGEKYMTTAFDFKGQPSIWTTVMIILLLATGTFVGILGVFFFLLFLAD